MPKIGYFALRSSFEPNECDLWVKAEAEAEKIIESGSKKLENEANKTREELKQQLSSIVVETASKIIDEEIDEKKHENIIKKAAKEI